jgi:hypothetical protein
MSEISSNKKGNFYPYEMRWLFMNHGLTLQIEKPQASADEEIGNVEKDQVYQGLGGKMYREEPEKLQASSRAARTQHSILCFLLFSLGFYGN